MRAALAFLLGVTIACPTAFASPAPVAAARDVCPICGHACCCPDVCAAQLKEQKARQRCANDASVCHMSASNDRAPVNLNMAERPRDQVAQSVADKPSLPNVWLSCVSDLTPLFSASPTLRLPIPPPRLTA